MKTLYITESGAILHIQARQLQVLYKQEVRQRVPIHQVEQIVLFGLCRLSRQVTTWISSRGIPVLYVSNTGQDLGNIAPTSRHRAKYRLHQLQCAQKPEFVRAIASSIIWAKLHNQSILLKQLTQNCFTPPAEKAIGMIALLIDDLPMAASVTALHQYEATAARFYYPALASFLPCSFGFGQRQQQPPTDAINQLLNLGHTLLHQQTSTLVQSLGLDVELGHLHLSCHHEQPLACDLIAEFRPLLVDELVVKLTSSSIITPEHFVAQNGSGIVLSPQVIKTFIQSWENQLQTLVVHPYAGTVSYRQCLKLQVQEYIACLLGDVEFYRPLVLKVNASNVAVDAAVEEIEPAILVKL